MSGGEHDETLDATWPGDRAMGERLGSIVAGYRLDELIGSGGMGTVYRATDLALDRPTALKMIKPAIAGDSGFRRRFVSESKLAASIDHPNVIDVFRAGEEDGALYVAMRLVEGEDLRTLLARAGALEPGVAVAIAAQVAAALDAAHARGLIHRDVKPANVLLGAHDHVFLTDFGLSKRVSADDDDEETVTADVVLGTLNYIAPEQISHDAGPRSDVYSLGCVVFEMLTGSVPFPVRGYEPKLWAHLSTPPPALGDVRHGLSPALDSVVQHALRKKPEERYESAGAFARDLQAMADAAAPATTTTARRRRIPAWPARNRAEDPALTPELAGLVADAEEATRALRRSHPALRKELDALTAAIRDRSRAVARDLGDLERDPPAELRRRLRAELMRGTAGSKGLVTSLKDRLLAMQEAERRCNAFRLELQRQLVELHSVTGAAGTEEQLGGRVARLRQELESLG